MPNGYLTTHVLDTATGRPAANMKIELYCVKGNARRKLAEMHTNSDGRTDSPILPESDFKTGMYELIFYAGEYLREAGTTQPEPFFLDEIPIRFGMNSPVHFHVPLLLSPYGYSTYRGS